MFPSFVLEVHDNNVGYFAVVDWVAENGSAFVVVSPRASHETYHS